MKITFIIPTLIEGGAEISTIAQANELSSRGYKVQVVVLSDMDELGKSLHKQVIYFKNNSKGLRLLGKKTIFSAVVSLKRLSREINTFAPDHIIAILKPAFLVTRLLVTLRMIKGKIWIYHRTTENLNMANLQGNKFMNRINNYLFYKSLAGRNEHHLMISKAVKKDIEDNEKIYQSSLIYNSVKLPHLDTNRRQELLKKFSLFEKKYVVIPGTLHPRKGHLFFLQSTSALIKKHKVRIIIVGYGAMENDIEKFISTHRMEENITLSGKLKNTDLLELVAGAYLCVIPSIREGLGNVAIEALAVGTTVLCSDAGGLPEIVTDQKTGYIFKREDPDDLVEKFEDIITHNERILAPEILKNEYLNRFTTKSQIDYLIELMASGKFQQ